MYITLKFHQNISHYNLDKGITRTDEKLMKGTKLQQKQGNGVIIHSSSSRLFDCARMFEGGGGRGKEGLTERKRGVIIL